MCKMFEAISLPVVADQMLFGRCSIECCTFFHHSNHFWGGFDSSLSTSKWLCFFSFKNQHSFLKE